MVKLITPVQFNPCAFDIQPGEKIAILGSCFADDLGLRLKDAGFDVCNNPFGTLYNPASIHNSLERLTSGRLFELSEAVEMGAGAGLFCSFSHHTSFARESAEAWKEAANDALTAAASFWKNCSTVILVPGNAWVWEHGASIVSNCLKRPAKEFTHRMMEMEECLELMKASLELCRGKKVILTVCPIRQMGESARANTLSKASLQLAVERCINNAPCQVDYFPSSEILLDELRDYRFYAGDLVHPSELAMDILWERFVAFIIPEGERERLRQNEKSARAARHKNIHQSI